MGDTRFVQRGGRPGFCAKGRFALNFALRHFAFNSRDHVIRACIAVCCVMAVASLLLGQDENWDLRNYHLHNGWAALHGRLSKDLVPSELQGYFAPWMDVVYYLLAVKGSPVLAGAVLGALHGLAFATVAAVVWQMLEGDARRVWLAPLFGLAGCCSTIFWSELGNTMGDNTSAPLIIGALALALRAARTGVVRHWLFAGALLGAAVSLKLTNIPYALGLGCAALVAGGVGTRRLRCTALMTLAALVVFATIAGPWYGMVWKQFGNPLFPQFNNWFHSPLVMPVSATDTRHLPENITEALLWPILMTVELYRTNEIGSPQLVWCVFYVLALFYAVKTVIQSTFRRAKHNDENMTDPVPVAERMFFVFIIVSFVAWMIIFSIRRYLIALELIAPLGVWLLARRALSGPSAEKWATGLAVVCVAVAFAATVPPLRWAVWGMTWGHENWAQQGFAIDKNFQIEHPEVATVLMVNGDGQSWRLPFLPAQLVYAAVEPNFPVTPFYVSRIHEIARKRGGQVYALFPAADNNGSCQCVLNANGRDENTALMALSRMQLRGYGWQIKPETCTIYASYIGAGNFPFHWCEVMPLS